VGYVRHRRSLISQINLTPTSLLYSALRLFVAPMSSHGRYRFNESLRLLIAFGIGAFPFRPSPIS